MAASDFKLIRPIVITDGIVDAHSVTEADATKWDGTGGLSAGVTRMVVDSTGSPSVITHGIYTLQSGGDSSQDPTADDGTNWVLTSYTNAWKMFDPEYQTQTIDADTIEVEITPLTGVNSVALLNVAGATATVSQSPSGYSETKTLVSHGTLSWYEWFFESPVRTGDVVFSSIPPYTGQTLTITVDNTGFDAAIGVCVIGKEKVIGATQWEANRSINDYSQATEALDGTVTLTQGAYSKRLNMEFRVEPGLESEATRILELYRATPLVFVGSEEYSMTIIYGFLGSWAVPISNTGANAYVEIKGLI